MRDHEDILIHRIEDSEAGQRLDRVLAARHPVLSRSRLKALIEGGQVGADGVTITEPSYRVKPGQRFAVIVPEAEPATPEGQAIPLDILYEDSTLLVIDKPAGLVVHPAPGNPDLTLVNALIAHCGDSLSGIGGVKRPGIVHRLDKDTSGVLLIARTPGSAAFFSKRFSGRSAKKVYWALIVGVPEVFEGQIDAPLSKQPGTGGEKMHVDEENGQAARTRYRVIERAGNRACWVELQPLTGRTHQLRVHMAAIGHPIVGDGKYGGQDAFLTGSISRKLHLHARRLVIEHPDGAPLDVTAELPEHFAASMEQLGFDMTLSDALPDDEPTPMSREQKKQSARQHSKQIRKERRGERRERIAGGRNEKDGVAKGRPKTGKSGPTKGKGSPKPAAGKSAAGKSAPGKRGASRSAPAKGAAPRGGPRKAGPPKRGR